MSPVETIDQYHKSDWWFFDTNCLSELVKRFNKGDHARVQKLVKGRYILIQVANLAELHRVEGLVEEISKALSTAAFIGVPVTAHPFVRRDLYKLLELTELFPNPFNLYELTDEFAMQLPHHQGFLEAVVQSNRDVQDEFINKGMPDIGAGLTPIIVYGYAKMALKTILESIVGQRTNDELLKKLPKNSQTFPSHFAFWFSYYFLYLTDDNVKVQNNDFNDLSLTMAAPICERFYTDRRLAHVLNKTKSFEIPSERMFRGAASRYGTQERSKRERQEELSRYSDQKGRVLQTTSVYPFSKLLAHLQE